MIQIVNDIRTHEVQFSGLVLTIGSFDGVHLGHRTILDEVLRQARARMGSSAVLTLKPHPREFFSPDHAPSLLTSESKKWQLFEQAGIDAVFVLPFDETVASLEPEAFVEEILVRRCRAESVVVGHDFRFGKRARGDFELLRNLASKSGFSVTQVEPLLMDGERVSSTLIRERLLLGDISKAEAFLGRPYSVVGEVVPGRHIGSSIGFPTANVRPHHSAIPAQGVYVAYTYLDGRAYPTAVNIGIAPTIRNEDMTIEAHLLDFSGNLEGREVEVAFLKRLRSEIRFPSVQDLIAQIQRDVAEVRAFFEAQTAL
ncbi:MAG: bifunctional riboflavin kinase/FAD synthetase [Candidatus Hydrogenedentes bacterium]|nr:bifunctional riboflavin kinase/FAD synthetase [Candidatus Hydrogenedentota bacterium]